MNKLQLMLIAGIMVLFFIFSSCRSEKIVQPAFDPGRIVTSPPTESLRPSTTNEQPTKSQPMSQPPTMDQSKTESLYSEYSDAKFQAARNAAKIIFLEFASETCPVCQAQDPQIKMAFAELNNPMIVGFKVNYDTEETMNQQYGVTYQHTHVILDENGNVLKKVSDPLSKNEILALLNSKNK